MRALYHHRTQGRGVEAVHITGVCGGLRELGFEVKVVGPPGINVDPDVVVASEEGKTGTIWGKIARHTPQVAFEFLEIAYNLAAVPRLWKQCRKVQPELIYERYALYNLAGAVVARLTGTPLIIEINETVSVDRTRQGKALMMPPLAAWFERQALRRAAGVVTVSGYLRDQVVALGIPAAQVRATPNAVDPRRFDPETVSGDAVRDRHGLRGKTVIGFVGSFTKWHGVDLLIQGCAELAREYPNLALLLIGDGAKRGEAEALATELGIRDRIIFAGKVPHGEVREHVAAMDMTVVPGANAFVSPVKVFEYMAMGRPTVATRYGSLEEVIQEGENGLLFEPNDLTALTGCLRALLENPEQRLAIGKSARQSVLSRHLWKHNAQVALDLVRRTDEGHPVRMEARPTPSH